MNYYEHHLGDYLRDTAHLSMIEDGAYRRLLDAYYIREAPLPLVLRDVFRLVRASSKQDREAVETVLREFFVETEDGWRHTRCDREIGRFSEGEPEREAKKANEALRLKRHREERAALFKQLTDAGQHAAWNVSMSELRAMVKRLQQPLPEMPPATAPATLATATHTHSPLPTPQAPEEKTFLLPLVGGSGTAQSAAPPTPAPDFDGKNAEALNGKAVVQIAAAWELPEQWGIDAEALGWKPSEVLLQAEKFRQYWTAGRGQGTRRSVKGWRQSWSTWLDKAAKDHR